MKLNILFQDENLVAIDKPPGLLVHRSLIDKGETEYAVQILRDQISQYVYPVHRLDKPTSGVLIFALTQAAAQSLSQKFVNGEITKVYWALGRGSANNQKVDYPLTEILDKKSDFKARQGKPAQSAVTEVFCLEQFEIPISVDKFPTSRYSLIKAIPQTGRKHQIRRHLRHLGHPIIGDVTYGVGKHNRFFESHFGVRQLMLTCVSLSFAHPITGEALCIEAPLSLGFHKVLDQLRREYAV